MSKDPRRGTARSTNRELFTVLNDHWKISETKEGLYELSFRDNPTAKLGPMAGEKLVAVLAVISELNRHLHEGR
jgi:hypothetical protein